MEDEGKLSELMTTSEHVGGSTGVENMSGGNGSFSKYVVVFLSYMYVYISNLMLIIKKESQSQP